MLHISIEPFFAPLSKPMITQALTLQEKKNTPTSTISLEQVISEYTTKCTLLRERMTEKRAEVFRLMQPIVESGRFTTDWLLASLTKYTPKKSPETPLSAETLSRWRDLGLVRYQERNTPDYDSGAALITLRSLIPDKERGWLPKPPKNAQKANYFGEEPLWWAWRQDSPTSPIIPCPIPLPEDIPPHALLWTDWLGAAWKPEWLRIGSLGSCRWAGTMILNKAMLWSMTEEHLEMWGIPIGTYKKALQNDIPLTLHTLSTSALLLLATERLENVKTTSFHLLPQAG